MVRDLRTRLRFETNLNIQQLHCLQKRKKERKQHTSDGRIQRGLSVHGVEASVDDPADDTCLASWWLCDTFSKVSPLLSEARILRSCKLRLMIERACNVHGLGDCLSTRRQIFLGFPSTCLGTRGSIVVVARALVLVPNTRKSGSGLNRAFLSSYKCPDLKRAAFMG